MSLAVSISCIKAAHLSSFYIHLFTFHEFLLDHVSLFQQTHLPTRWLKIGYLYSCILHINVTFLLSLKVWMYGNSGLKHMSRVKKRLVCMNGLRGRLYLLI
jgi:hypothetical protein